MKHLIWQPAVDELLPETTVIAYQWGALDVVAAIVEDVFTTPGTILYDSSDPAIIPPAALIHTFAGWPNA